MNIIWLTLESLLPSNTGGRIGVFKRLEYVSRSANIYLFYPYDDDVDLEYIADLKKVCVEVHAYRRTDNLRKALMNIVRYPYTVGSRKINDMRKDIDACIKDNNIDLINVDFPHMCVNLLGAEYNIPIILNEHNVEWMVYKRIARSQADLLKKFAYWIDSYRLKNFERKLFRRLPFSRVTFVSPHDMKMITEEGLCGPDICDVVPVGAEKREIRHADSKQGHTILFVGKMSYGPNVEAVIWFSEMVLPLIKKEIPDTVFYIVGKDPSDRMRQLASDSVFVTGTVDKVDDYYDLADVVVLPLMNGGGVKVKLLEAASFQKYIVSTSVGVEGTLFEDGETVCVFDEPNGFAQACLDGLQHTEETERRRLATYDLFLREYTWDSIGRQYLDILNQVIFDGAKRRQDNQME